MVLYSPRWKCKEIKGQESWRRNAHELDLREKELILFPIGSDAESSSSQTEEQRDKPRSPAFITSASTQITLFFLKEEKSRHLSYRSLSSLHENLLHSDIWSKSNTHRWFEKNQLNKEKNKKNNNNKKTASCLINFPLGHVEAFYQHLLLLLLSQMRSEALCSITVWIQSHASRFAKDTQEEVGDEWDDTGGNVDINPTIPLEAPPGGH